MARRSATQFSDFEQNIQEHLGRAYQRVFGSGPGGKNFCPPYMEPPVDVYHTDSEVVVLMEIAGIPEEEIEIEVEGLSMLIRGERKRLKGRPGRRYSHMEIVHGPFQRAIRLPSEVNPQEATAVYKDGILEIALPRAAPSRGTHLRIMVR
jgi:HSP20 family protein